MNPVTELVTGVDIIREQIRVTAGEKLSFQQKDIVHRGGAIEVRINAEDPAKDFRPSAGVVKTWRPPGGRSILPRGTMCTRRRFWMALRSLDAPFSSCVTAVVLQLNRPS